MLFTDPPFGLVRIYYFSVPQVERSDNMEHVFQIKLCVFWPWESLTESHRESRLMRCTSSQMFSHWHLTEDHALLFLHQLHFLVFWLHSTLHKNFHICHLLSYCLIQNIDCMKVEPWLRLLSLLVKAVVKSCKFCLCFSNPANTTAGAEFCIFISNWLLGKQYSWMWLLSVLHFLFLVSNFDGKSIIMSKFSGVLDSLHLWCHRCSSVLKTNIYS